MCGFVGFYNLDGSTVDPQVLWRMTDLQRHRGPDDEALLLFSLKNRVAKPVKERDEGPTGVFDGGIGFNRLSILDLSEHGHQPMSNRDGSVFIAFNGEIYNAFDYRAELEAAGFHFKSRTDTEVILYLYERYGFVAALERLNGMFSVCIVDLNRRQINLARDRMGIKPLYWCETGGVFLFSSEVKSFLEHPRFTPELDSDHIDEYLLFRYCARNAFLLKGVHQLEPGHWMKLTPGGREEHSYWEIPDGGSKNAISFDAASQKLEQHLRRSIKMQLLSDVKVGCQLSGGIDSSLINLFAPQLAGADLDAFSVTFDDPLFSEQKWIEEAASRAQVVSHQCVLSTEYVLDHMRLTTWYLDQPLNHPSSIGIFRLAETASSQVTVLLSGEGADELFGGYIRFLYAMLWSELRTWLPVLKRVPVAGRRYAQRFAGLGEMDPVDWFIMESASQGLDRVAAIRPEARVDRVLGERRSLFESGNGGYIDNCFKYELGTYLVDLLVRQDKMTMAHSMENRVPFLDHEFVTFVRELPPEYLLKKRLRLNRMRMRNTKVLLKKLAEKYFGSEFTYRPKYGFDLPLQSYFSDRRFEPVMQDVLLPGMRSRGLVRAEVVERWWRDLKSGDPGASTSIWICVALELWAQQFLDGNRPAVPEVRPARTSASATS